MASIAVGLTKSYNWYDFETHRQRHIAAVVIVDQERHPEQDPCLWHLCRDLSNLFSGS